MYQTVKDSECPYHFGAHLHCPFCQDCYCHLEAVTVDRNGDIVKVEHDDVSFLNQPSDARGSIVSITCWCESGHHWNLMFRFHKGVVLFAVNQLSEATNLAYPDLWRD